MPHRLLTTEEMRRADALTIAAGTAGFVLMKRAGQAVAHEAASLAREQARILVLCGPGHNGGDGFVAGHALRSAGFAVEVTLLGAPERLKGDAKEAAALWGGPIGRAEDADPSGAVIIVDALFGAGLDRDLVGAARQIVERANASGRPILAVDVPSGIDGDTGFVRGAAIRAARTVTFARRKPGHLLQPGRSHCGPTVVADIGITDETIAAVAGRTCANAPELWGAVFPRLTDDVHKYDRGHALVLSGGALNSGAARLAARGALRAGAGLVTIASPGDALTVNAAHLTAIMLRRCDGASDLAELLSDRRFNAIGLGPALGVGERTRELVAAALRTGRSVVLDADALTSFEGAAPDLTSVVTGTAVLTPHDGEFARLFRGCDEVLDIPSKLERTRAAARASKSAVVLKGSDTVIAAPDGRAAINENGTPFLATAGSGDVLTGIVCGLLAQGMRGFEAACAAVWLHAEAGRRLGPGLIAEDLPEALPGVLRELLSA
jgi:hydroxyethylthiazole kinase-like uncharacterized protein yjeF